MAGRRSSEPEPVALVEIAAVVIGEVAQALEIVKLDATIPKRHEATLAQLAQDAVHVDGGEPQRIGHEILVERANEAAVRAEPHELQAQRYSSSRRCAVRTRALRRPMLTRPSTTIASSREAAHRIAAANRGTR